MASAQMLCPHRLLVLYFGKDMTGPKDQREQDMILGRILDIMTWEYYCVEI